MSGYHNYDDVISSNLKSLLACMLAVNQREMLMRNLILLFIFQLKKTCLLLSTIEQWVMLHWLRIGQWVMFHLIAIFNM